jgi:acyl-CoA reductase-like NAD-dependent aldehyde dehydrogenase
VIAVINPYNGSVVGEIPETDLDTFSTTVGQMLSSPRKSKRLRAGALFSFAAVLQKKKNDFAELITAESGLCIKDSSYELDRALNVTLNAAARCLDDIEDETYAFHGKGSIDSAWMQVHTSPCRLTYAVTPFNHPLNQVLHKALPAIAAGTKVIVAPSTKTPLTCRAMLTELWDCGLEPGDINMAINRNPAILLDEVLKIPALDVVSFTGSYEVGRLIGKKINASDTSWNIRYICEMGGSSPLIVGSDACVKLAAKIIMNGCFKNSGQRCTAIRRVLVPEPKAQELVDELMPLIGSLIIGDPRDSKTDMGSLISEEAAENVRAAILGAKRQGAKILHMRALNGASIGPILLDHVRNDMDVVTSEVFGPLCNIIRTQSDSDSLKIAAESKYGLAASIVTSKEELIKLFIDQVDVGQKNINSHPGFRSENAPFGGKGISGNYYYEGVEMAIRSFRTHSSVYRHFGE